MRSRLVPTSLLLALACVASSCDLWHVFDDVFNRQPASTANAWMGGDGAVSVPLPNDRSLWVFGDTWVGGYDSANNKRTHKAFLKGNTIGLLNTTSNPAYGNIDFFGRSGASATTITTNSTGAVGEFFDYSMFPSLPKPAANLIYGFWPNGGACLDCTDASSANDRLLVSLVEMRFCDSPAGPSCIALLGLQPVSNVLAIINNPNDAPSAWHITAADPAPSRVALSTSNVAWGNAFVEDGGFIYVYGSEIMGATNLFAARTTRANILTPLQWEYCVPNNGASCFKKLAALPSTTGLKVVAENVGTLASVTKMTRWGVTQFVLVHDRPSVNHYVYVRTSSSPSSWPVIDRHTPKADLFTIDSSLSGAIALLFFQGKCTTVEKCSLNYHSRAQPHLSPSDSHGDASSLYFSYIIPSGTDTTGDDANYYRPKFGSLPMDNVAPWCTQAGLPCWNGVGALEANTIGLHSSDYYNFDVSQAINDTFEVELTGGTGDPDLYVRFDNIPSTTDYACRSWTVGAVEHCSVPIPAGVSTAEVLVYGYAAGSYGMLAAYPRK